ncbi:MAG: class I SAM-dependent methyltransferase [Chloroflexota bacterium]
MEHKPFHRFDDEERRNWQNPEAVLAEIGLKPGDTFMDIGCGGGFFTLPAARLVGERGKVYGVDTDSESLERLAQKARREGLQNLELVVGRGEETIICQACADVVFFGIVLHDFDDPVKVLQNARRMLKPVGRLVNLDWKKEPMSLGPPLGKRFTEEKAVSLIESAGFKVTTVKDSGKLHYLVIALPA